MTDRLDLPGPRHLLDRIFFPRFLCSREEAIAPAAPEQFLERVEQEGPPFLRPARAVCPTRAQAAKGSSASEPANATRSNDRAERGMD